ncbi:MAG TPA: hypothetical protein VFR63_00405 [Gaiellaceae bacterium]|nr:hypothetical protein [Gaiellaceae bacterium]
MELRRQQALELPTRPSLALAATLLAAAALAAGSAAAAVPQAPVYDSRGNLVGTPFVPAQEEPQLREREAIGRALAEGKVAAWVSRYPGRTLTKEADFDEEARVWTVEVWSSLPDAGQIVLAKVDDASGAVTEAWTGPQVAWKMARGYDGAFGRKINDPWIWLSLCAVFLVGLADLRRPLSVRNLDLLVLLSFGISLYFFNRGDVFTAMPLAYPPLLYLLGRMAWIGRRGRGSLSRPVWPVWVLLAATVFLAGFRFGLNVQASNVIDVGLAGVIGAQRIVEDGQMPYGNMPTDVGKECGEPDADGYVRERIQTNGRCEVANGRGDTYGPVSYLAYVPGFLALGWSYEWDDLPAAHFTSLLWDGLALLGMGLLGLRFGGLRLGATLAFAWAAYPFTQYVSSSNSNDAIMPALLVWGLLFVTSAPARGLLAGLAAWTKFAAFLLFPLWASYPRATRWPRGQLLFLGGALVATAVGFSILLLEPDPLHAARVFWDRTFGWQLSRPSPFSIWDWDEYPGYPDLHVVQTVLKGVLLAAAVALAFVPRTRNVVQLAALTGALLIGFELVLTHWFYLYIPWFFPFVAFALLVPASVRVARPEPRPEEPSSERQVGELVPAR